MKKFVSATIALLWCNIVSAQTIWAYADQNHKVQSSSELGHKSVCDDVQFEAPYTRTLYRQVVQRNWFLNGTRVTLLGNNDAIVRIKMMKEVQNEVYCILTIQVDTLGTTTTHTITTPTFVVNMNSVGIGIEALGTAWYGCTNPITLGHYTDNWMFVKPPDAPYTLAWTLPAGWSQVSATAGNHQVVVRPSQYGGGTVSAIVTLSCGATKTVTTTIPRQIPPAPQFTDFTSTVCSGTVRYSVTPVCGASGYIFETSVNALKFSNGLNTITTTEPYVDITYDGSLSFVSGLSVKAVFPNGVTTDANSRDIQFGTPTIVLNPYTITCTSTSVTVSVQNALYYDFIDWFRADNNRYLGSGSTKALPVNGYMYLIEAGNACGIATTRVRVLVPSCPGTFSVSPNPVNGILRVHMPVEDSENARTTTAELTFNLYNLNSTVLIKTWKEMAGRKQYQFNMTGIPKGQYILQMVGAKGKTSKQVVVE